MASVHNSLHCLRLRIDLTLPSQLTEMQRERSKDDYSQNKALRRTMRARRKAAAALDSERQALHLPEHIPLLAPSEEDAAAAKLVKFGPAGGRFDDNRSLARRGIMAAPLLAPTPGAKARLRIVGRLGSGLSRRSEAFPTAG